MIYHTVWQGVIQGVFEIGNRFWAHENRCPNFDKLTKNKVFTKNLIIKNEAKHKLPPMYIKHQNFSSYLLLLLMTSYILKFLDKMPGFVKYSISLFDFSLLSPLMPGGNKRSNHGHTYPQKAANFSCRFVEVCMTFCYDQA